MDLGSYLVEMKIFSQNAIVISEKNNFKCFQCKIPYVFSTNTSQKHIA